MALKPPPPKTYTVSIDDLKKSIGFVAPPVALLPPVGDERHEPWYALYEWYSDVAKIDGDDALSIIVAERYGVTLTEAYAMHDRWAEENRDPDEYISYN